MTSQNHKPESIGRILEAAEILFSEKGFEGTSINAIAKVAEVSKANIYHHFESKEALYIQVLKSACADFGNVVDGLISDRGLLEDRLGKFASAHIIDLEKRNRGTRLILRELIEGNQNRQLLFAENVASDHFKHLLSKIIGVRYKLNTICFLICTWPQLFWNAALGWDVVVGKG